jgi:hypothetical protein
MPPPPRRRRCGGAALETDRPASGSPCRLYDNRAARRQRITAARSGERSTTGSLIHFSHVLTAIAAPASPSPFRAALASWVIGVRRALGAPVLLFGIYFLLLLLTAPLVASLSSALAALLDASGLAEMTAGPVPLPDWAPFTRRNHPLVETFAPRILGAAAPVDTLSRLADAALPPRVVLAGALVYGALWTLLWGGVLGYFAGGLTGWGAFVRAALRSAAPLARLAACTIGVSVIALLVQSRVLDVLVAALPASMSEREVFTVRALWYLAFGLLLVCGTALVDYTRIEIVLGGRARVRDALAASWRFIRAHPAAVAMLALSSTLLFAGALAAYAAFDLANRGAPSPWAAIIVGQVYILLRLAGRLITAAAQVELKTRLVRGR